MSEHLKSAEYHRSMADKEFARQGTSGLSDSGYAASRSAQMVHMNAAHAAAAAHAEATGTHVVYTPVGTSVYQKGW